MTTMLSDFLLFNYDSWAAYNKIILGVAQNVIYPVFVFALLIDRFLERQQPMQILKRVLLAQVILISMPLYYKGVIGFGFDVGNNLLSKQTTGLVANWTKITKRAEIQMKKKPDTLDVVKAFFSFDGASVVEKMAATLIFICILLLKVIYSVVYYGTYSAVPILCLLAIFPKFENHLQGAFKSILFLIIEVILVAFVLLFMNSTISFGINANGFMTGLVAIAKFLVLVFILLGTLKMSHSLINGSGIESWAGGMGQMLGAGLAYKTMGLGMSAAGTTGKVGKDALTTAGGVVGGKVASSLFKASAPLKTGAGALFNNAKSFLSNSASRIDKTQTSMPNIGVDSDPRTVGGSSVNSGSSSQGANTYANNFQNVASDSSGKISNSSAINPVNHAKATYQTGRAGVSNLVKDVKNFVGLPEYSKNLSFKEKSVFMANKVIGGGLNNQQQIKNGIIANKISNSLGGRSGKA